MFARSITLALAALAVAITLLVWRTDARSSNLGALSALCSANPACTQSAGSTAGSVLFRIRADDALVRIQCVDDGTCQRIEPKAPRTSIFNAVQLISFK
jgi:hypothetical protein